MISNQRSDAFIGACDKSALFVMYFAVWVKNEDVSASREIGKIYRMIPDTEAAAHHLTCVIGESGEDYLYPGDYFMLRGYIID